MLRGLRVLNVLSVAILVMAAAVMLAPSADAQREGWIILKTGHSYQELVNQVDLAAKANKIGVVTRASASEGASKVLGENIPGNMVIGLYHPRFAVRMLNASIAAGIEAPIRLYLTENPDGTATLSYKKPSTVFAPYMAEGGEPLKELASELDALFEKLTSEAAAKN